MAETHDLGNLYVQSFCYPRVLAKRPRVERCETIETEEPYRRGRGFVLRFGRYRALVVGRWSPDELGDEDERLMEAVRGIYLEVTPEEIAAWTEEKIHDTQETPHG